MLRIVRIYTLKIRRSFCHRTEIGAMSLVLYTTSLFLVHGCYVRNFGTLVLKARRPIELSGRLASTCLGGVDKVSYPQPDGGGDNEAEEAVGSLP